MIQTRNRAVSPAVRNLLPAVLIDYLWTLAEGTRAAQAFLLTTQVLGGKRLQKIHHVCGGETLAVHKVFGFEPVNACILITVQGDALGMETGSLLETMEPLPAE